MNNVVKKLINSVAENRPIYKLFLSKIDRLENVNVNKTKYRGKDSENSLQYSEDSFNALFCGPNDKTLFDEKFEEATFYGKGLESTRIRTMHSSSLLSFVTFYNVTKDNPITFNELNELSFTKVHFEHENIIENSNRKSHIDILLSDEDEKNVLFLESKFSEYLSCGKVSNISRAYRDEFDNFINELNLLGDTTKLCLEPNEDNTSFTLQASSGRTTVYCEGIKQMICHYLGAVKYANDNPSKEIYLGTILYQLPQEIDKQGKFESYEKLYQEWAKAATQLNTHKNLQILENPVLYNDLYKDTFHRFPNNVKNIYK